MGKLYLIKPLELSEMKRNTIQEYDCGGYGSAAARYESVIKVFVTCEITLIE